MGTRFWLDSTNAAAVSPAFSAEWDKTTVTAPSAGDAPRLALNHVRGSSTLTTITFDETSNQNLPDWDHLAAQFVSAPLAAQTIAGTLKGRMRVSESGAAANARSQIILRVCSNDGTTFRGTLYAGDLATLTGNPTSEWATSLTNRQMPRGTSVNLSSVTLQEGDRLVYEPGMRQHNTANNAFGYSVRVGESGASDLPEDETTTTDLNPWIEFSQRIYLPNSRKLWVVM